jgi:predicted dehydrogenase
MMERIKVGLIGYGYWGPNLLRNFAEIPNSEVVVVSDLKEERFSQIKNNYPQIELTHDYKDLFKMGLDAIIVATPPKTHFQIAQDCLNHEHHVFVEKPLTLNSSEAEQLIDIAREKDRVLMVGHTFEYNVAVHALKNLIDSGELGDIYYLDAARLNLGLFQKDADVLWDLAPHDVSILIYLMGHPPISVSARGMSCVFNDIQEVAYLNLVFPRNIMAHIHVSWLDPCKVRRVTVVGSKKMAVYNDLETNEKIKIYDKGVEAPAYPSNFGEFQCSYRYGDVLIPNIRFIEPLRTECQHFLDCIIHHSTPCSDGKAGLRVVKVIEAAERSLHNGGHMEELVW